jgi:arsenate reductase-like glutaredoxin family protein
VTDKEEERNIPFVVIDYDTEGLDEEELTKVKQGDGTESDAYVSADYAGKAKIDIADLVEQMRHLYDLEKKDDS